MSTERELRAELAQTQVQLHQLNTAVQRQLGALDTVLRSIEQTLSHLAQSEALPRPFAEQNQATLVGARNVIVSTGTYLHWRLRGGAPRRQDY